MSIRHILSTAAVCVMLAATASAETKLRPDQQKALDATLQQIEPANRAVAREQMAASFASFSPAQIKMIMANLEKQKAEKIAAEKEAAKPPAPEKVATPADLAYNKAQYEPVIRKFHANQKAFDDFANAKLAAYCPTNRDTFARFGSAWRYELFALTQPWATASWNPDIDVEVLGGTYAPQDGRYKFDFSKVPASFDKTAADAAVKTACDAYKIKGAEFLKKLDPLIATKNWDAAFKLEQTANSGIEPIRMKMKASLDKVDPNIGFGYPILAALQNAKPVK